MSFFCLFLYHLIIIPSIRKNYLQSSNCLKTNNFYIHQTVQKQKKKKRLGFIAFDHYLQIYVIKKKKSKS